MLCTALNMHTYSVVRLDQNTIMCPVCWQGCLCGSVGIFVCSEACPHDRNCDCVCACECVSSRNQWAMCLSSQRAPELSKVVVGDTVTFTAQRLMETPCCTWPSLIISENHATERKEPQ